MFLFAGQVASWNEWPTLAPPPLSILNAPYKLWLLLMPGAARPSSAIIDFDAAAMRPSAKNADLCFDIVVAKQFEEWERKRHLERLQHEIEEFIQTRLSDVAEGTRWRTKLNSLIRGRFDQLEQDNRELKAAVARLSERLDARAP